MQSTLAYFDVFDYPLTREELIKFSHIKGLSFANAKVSSYWNFLPGRKKIVALRRQRQRFSQLKWQKLTKLKWLFFLVPWIKFVAITGALAMDNATENDDIDLMIITQKNRLWLTRIVLIILFFPWLRRGNKIHNRLCFNLFLDETALKLELKNLYIAHELVQIKPIINKNKTYQKLIQANLWIKTFLPNWKI